MLEGFSNLKHIVREVVSWMLPCETTSLLNVDKRQLSNIQKKMANVLFKSYL